MGWARMHYGTGCNRDQVFDSAVRRLVFTVLIGAGAAAVALAVPACSNNTPQITSAAGNGAPAAGGSAVGGSDPVPGSSTAGGSHPVPGSPAIGSVPAAVSRANDDGNLTACPTQGVGGDNLPPLCAVPSPGTSAVSVTPPPTASPTSTLPQAQAPLPGPSCSVPTVTSVSPDQGAETGGDTVTITGTGFGEGADVSFGGTPAIGVTLKSDTQITAVSPSEQPGQPATVDITVSCAGNVSRVVAADEFSYSTAIAPSVRSSAGP
jgi:IPT/TIG domain